MDGSSLLTPSLVTIFCYLLNTFVCLFVCFCFSFCIPLFNTGNEEVVSILKCMTCYVWYSLSTDLFVQFQLLFALLTQQFATYSDIASLRCQKQCYRPSLIEKYWFSEAFTFLILSLRFAFVISVAQYIYLNALYLRLSSV